MAAGDAELVRSALDGFFAGDAAALRERLAPDAEWLWHEPSDYDCHGREQLVATLEKRRHQRIVTRVVDVREGADGEVLVSWFGERMERRFGVPDGIASMVVTVNEGRIVRMRDFPRPSEALEAAGLAA
jgi:ketosteroid isomerase-like protein